MASIFTESKKRYDQEIKLMEQIENSYVLIGFQEGSVTRSQTKGKRRKEAGKSQAQIAAENEFGTNKIPARSFMRTSFDENVQRVVNIITAEYEKILDGQSTVRKSLNAIGYMVLIWCNKR